jgi:hypothetical protein
MSGKYMKNCITYAITNMPYEFTDMFDTNTLLKLCTLNKSISNKLGNELGTNKIWERREQVAIFTMELMGWKINTTSKITHNVYSVTQLRMFGSGRIPSFITDFRKLNELSIHEKHGRVIGTIPENIGLLEHLEHLHINDCHLVSYIPKSICKLHKLTSLSLDNNVILGDIPYEMLNEYNEHGPLRHNRSYINIWKQAQHGHLCVYQGSILKMSESNMLMSSPYAKFGEDEDEVEGDEGDNTLGKWDDYISPPLLLRSNAFRFDRYEDGVTGLQF